MTHSSGVFLLPFVLLQLEQAKSLFKLLICRSCSEVDLENCTFEVSFNSNLNFARFMEIAQLFEMKMSVLSLSNLSCPSSFLSTLSADSCAPDRLSVLPDS